MFSVFPGKIYFAKKHGQHHTGIFYDYTHGEFVRSSVGLQKTGAV